MEDYPGQSPSKAKIALKDGPVEAFLFLAPPIRQTSTYHPLSLFNSISPMLMPKILMHFFIVSCSIEIWKLKRENKHLAWSN